MLPAQAPLILLPLKPIDVALELREELVAHLRLGLLDLLLTLLLELGQALLHVLDDVEVFFGHEAASQFPYFSSLVTVGVHPL